jgi:uncharacterized protein YqeY
MTLIQTIKEHNLNARIQKLTAVSGLLTTLIGEAEMIGKNAGNRAPTDDEVLTLIRKFIKNNNETIALLAVVAGDGGARALAIMGENHTLERYLPKQMTTEELAEAIQSCITSIRVAGAPVNTGSIMKMMKQHFDGTFDGKAASLVIKAALA